MDYNASRSQYCFIIFTATAIKQDYLTTLLNAGASINTRKVTHDIEFTDNTAPTFIDFHALALSNILIGDAIFDAFPGITVIGVIGISFFAISRLRPKLSAIFANAIGLFELNITRAPRPPRQCPCATLEQ